MTGSLKAFENVASSAKMWRDWADNPDPDMAANVKQAIVDAVNETADRIAAEYQVTADMVLGLAVGSAIQAYTTAELANPMLKILGSVVGNGGADLPFGGLVAGCLSARVLDGTIPMPDPERPTS